MKKRKKIGLTIGYIFSAIVVVFGTYLLVQLASGNTLDILSGKIKPSGLVLFDSNPNGGSVYVNGKLQKAKTPSRLTSIEPGSITVKMQKSGFRDWEAQASVKAGQVTFLTYTIFVPTTVQTETIFGGKTITDSAQSTNHKRSFLVVGSTNPTVESTDNFTSTTSIYATNSITPAVTDLKILTTSDDGNSAVLNQKQADGKLSYIYVDGKGSKTSQNLTEQYKISAGQLQFNPDNNSELFWLDGTSLRKISLDSRTISAVLADNISYYRATNKRVYCIQTTSAYKNLFSMGYDGGRKTKILSGIEDSPSYRIEAVSFNGNDYFSLLSAKSARLTIYKDTGSTGAKAGGVLENVKDMSFTQNGRYLGINQADALNTYDVEKNEFVTYGTSLAGLTSWQWYDDHHLLTTMDHAIHLIDYDGQNDQVLSDAFSFRTKPMIYNRNIIAPHLDGTHLSLTNLLLFEKR